MGYALVHKTAKNIALKWYASERGAKIGTKAANRNAGYDAYTYVSEEERAAVDPVVTVKSLMSDKDVQIRASDRGGACDPSTERYWSM